MLPFESIKRMDRNGVSQVDLEEDLSADSLLATAQEMVRSGIEPLRSNAEAAYLAFVAYYVANASDSLKGEILSAAESFANSVGLEKLPELPEKLK